MDKSNTPTRGASEKPLRKRRSARKAEWAERETPGASTLSPEDAPQTSPELEGEGDSESGPATDPNVIWARAMTDLIDRLDARTENLVKVLSRKSPELEAINRKLTELDKRVAGLKGSVSPKPKGKGWAKGLGERFKRLRPVGTKGKAPESGGTQPAATSEPPLVPFHKEIGDKGILGITAFGLNDEQLVKVLDTVEADCERRGAVPVFLTDNDSFELFRARGMIFEYLPPPELREKFAPDLPWDLYLQRRYALFQRKWRPSGIISFGKRLPVEGEQEGGGVSGPPGAPPVPPKG